MSLILTESADIRKTLCLLCKTANCVPCARNMYIARLRAIYILLISRTHIAPIHMSNIHIAQPHTRNMYMYMYMYIYIYIYIYIGTAHAQYIYCLSLHYRSTIIIGIHKDT